MTVGHFTSTSIVNTTDARFCSKWLTTWRKLGLPASEQAGCICSMAMPPCIKPLRWKTIWLSRKSRFCLTLPMQPWPCTLWFLLISFVDRVHCRNAVHSVPGSSKRGQFTAPMGALLQVLEVLQEIDPKAETVYRSWRSVFWRTEIDIIWMK